MFSFLFAGRSRPSIRAVALLIGALAVLRANAEIITVGPSVDCDHGDIQAAIDATNGTDTYLIRATGNFTDEHLVINGKHLTLEGGYASCDATSPTGTSTVSAGTHTGDSVIEVRGFAAVTLSRLTISGGSIDSDNGAGGGINFDGHGSVTLSNVGITHNASAYGAGINVDSVGGAAELHIGDNVSILLNTASTSGGGIRMHGGSVLYLLGDNDFIFGNQAVDGNGGGIEVVAPSTAFIGSPGSAGGLIVGNSAQVGGGISITGAGGLSDTPTVQLFSVDPTRPVRISHNTAAVSGGGIQLATNVGSTTVSVPHLCAQDFRIDANSAPDGSAIFSSTDSSGGQDYSGVVLLNRFDPHYCAQTAPETLGAQPCAASLNGVSCNVIDGNLAQSADGTPTTGAAIAIRTQNSQWPAFEGDRFAMLRNHGGRALQLHLDNGNVSQLSNCLFAENVLSQQLIDTEGDSPVDIENCTFANDAFSGLFATGPVLAVSDDVELSNSIVWEPGVSSLAFVGGSGQLNVGDVISNDTQSLGGGPTLLNVDPRFVDVRAGGDYHLQAASAGVDFSGSGQWADLDGNARGVDLALKPNALGPFDLGAYERQDVGNLVRNGEFDADIHLWSDATEGASSWDGSTDRAGSASSGSIKVTVPPSATSILGATQCVHLPGLSDYALSGYARAFSSVTGVSNHASIVWTLRSDSDDCSGPVAAQGELALPSSNPIAWRQAAAPAVIPALDLASQFTVNTTVALTLKVSVTGAITNGGAAWFDGITLVPTDGVPSDIIFADGFEL